MIESAIGVYTGELQVQRVGYHDKPRLEAAIPDGVQRSPRDVAAVAGVTAVAVRAEAAALVSSNERTYGVSVVGVQPGREPAVSSIPGAVRDGRYLRRTDDVGGRRRPDPGPQPVGRGRRRADHARPGPRRLARRHASARSWACSRADRRTSTARSWRCRSPAMQSAFALDDEAHSIVVRTQHARGRAGRGDGAIRTLAARTARRWPCCPGTSCSRG